MERWILYLKVKMRCSMKNNGKKSTQANQNRSPFLSCRDDCSDAHRHSEGL